MSIRRIEASNYALTKAFTLCLTVSAVTLMSKPLEMWETFSTSPLASFMRAVRPFLMVPYASEAHLSASNSWVAVTPPVRVVRRDLVDMTSTSVTMGLRPHLSAA